MVARLLDRSCNLATLFVQSDFDELQQHSDAARSSADESRQGWRVSEVKQTYLPYSDPANLMVAEKLAALLRPDLAAKKAMQWLRDVCRRRRVNPIPCRNISRCLIFDWQLVSQWIRECPAHITHSPHRRRRKEEIARVKATKAAKKARGFLASAEAAA